MTTVEAWYEVDQHDAHVLTDEGQVEVLLDKLAARAEARLVSLFTGDALEDVGGFPSVEFLVGVGGGVQRGVLRVADTEGLWISRGDDVDCDPVVYHYMNVPHEFPANAELPLEEVKAAVREFVHTGRRPACVQWQPGE
jgi:hypothetical protein